MTKFLEYVIDSLIKKIMGSACHSENDQSLNTWKIDQFYQGKIMFYTSHTETASHVCKSTLLFRSIHKIERSAKLFLNYTFSRKRSIRTCQNRKRRRKAAHSVGIMIRLCSDQEWIWNDRRIYFISRVLERIRLEHI